MDEFEIVATAPNKPEGVWTRMSLFNAQRVADNAIKHGYQRAQVFNIFGGDRSEPLYTATVESK